MANDRWATDGHYEQTLEFECAADQRVYRLRLYSLPHAPHRWWWVIDDGYGSRFCSGPLMGYLQGSPEELRDQAVEAAVDALLSAVDGLRLAASVE